jgi:release factor glutamine methyltransferase
VGEVRDATALLERAGVPSPAHDARVLLAHARTSGDDAGQLLAARAARVPLQHLVGTAGFRYLDLLVGPGVFVPRPETELVVDAALAALAGVPTPRVVDLCAGTGAVGLSVAHEHPAAEVWLVEREPAAYDWLVRNCAGRQRVHPLLADLADAPTGMDGTADVVTANPPYLPDAERELLDPEVRDHDPAAALWGGYDGLDVLRRVAERASVLLRPGGTLVAEHADGQGETAPAVLRAAGFTGVTDHLDLAGRPRYVVGVRP